MRLKGWGCVGAGGCGCRAACRGASGCRAERVRGENWVMVAHRGSNGVLGALKSEKGLGKVWGLRL